MQEPGNVGELALLARQAYMARMERAQSGQRIQVDLQHGSPGQVQASHAQNDGFANAYRRETQAQPANQEALRQLAVLRGKSGTVYEQAQPEMAQPQAAATAPAPPEVQPALNPVEARLETLPGQRNRVPLEGGLRGNLPPGVDRGNELRDVAAELRNIRAEITTLSRMLGFPSRQIPDFRGILQQHDQRDSDVQAERYVHELPLMKAKGERTEGLVEQQQEIRDMSRRNAMERIERRQHDLLLALQRAESRLAQAPDTDDNLRNQIIGEIYRARYSIAVFGGMRSAQLSGLNVDQYAA